MKKADLNLDERVDSGQFWNFFYSAWLASVLNALSVVSTIELNL